MIIPIHSVPNPVPTHVLADSAVYREHRVAGLARRQAPNGAGAPAGGMPGSNTPKTMDLPIPGVLSDDVALELGDLLKREFGLTAKPTLYRAHDGYHVILTAPADQIAQAKELLKHAAELQIPGPRLQTTVHRLKNITALAAVSALQMIKDTNNYTWRFGPGPEVLQPGAGLQFVNALPANSGTGQGGKGLHIETTGPGAKFLSAGTGPLDPHDSAPAGDAGNGDSGSDNKTPPAPHLPFVILIGTPAEIAEMEGFLDQLDQKSAQVMIEAMVLEVAPQAIDTIGVQWTDAAGKVTGSTITETAPRENNVIRFGTFNRRGIQFNAAINAAISRGYARLVADPTIAVQDQTEAAIFIGDQINYLGLQANTPLTGTPALVVLSQNVGVTLDVTPVVNLEGEAVTLKLIPTVSTLTRFDPIPGGGILPQIGTRQANTTVRLNNDEVFAIGGLIQEQDIRQLDKVPLLGDLPIIGHLFRNRHTEHRRTEILLFIRARVVNEERSGADEPTVLHPDLLRRDPAFAEIHPLVRQLGLSLGIITPGDATRLGLRDYSGRIIVTTVLPGSRADQAGIKRGDVIVRAGGGEIRTEDELESVVSSRAPGSELQLEIGRAGSNKSEIVTIPALPPAPVSHGGRRH